MGSRCFRPSSSKEVAMPTYGEFEPLYDEDFEITEKPEPPALSESQRQELTRQIEELKQPLRAAADRQMSFSF